MVNSSLYNPDTWQLGDGTGLFRLPDFSMVGYERGDIAPPTPQVVLNIQDAPYNADPTGKLDCSAIINQALSDANDIVQAMDVKIPVAIYLGEGLFRCKRTTSTRCIVNTFSYVGLVGAGQGKSILYYADEVQRDCSLIRSAPPTGAGSWESASTGTTRLLAGNIEKYSNQITLSSVSGIAVGDYVVVMTDLTQRMIDEYNYDVSTDWVVDEFNGQRYLREVTSITGNTLTVDVYFPLAVLTADNARLDVIEDELPSYQHYEDFSVACRPLTFPQGELDSQDTEADTLAYRCKSHSMISANLVVNCVIKNISSVSLDEYAFNPQYFTGDKPHIPSLGINLVRGYLCTVDNVSFANPSSNSAGGNGYLMNITGNCLLIKNSNFYGGRHNTSINSMITSLIVFHNNTYQKGWAAVDNHRHLSHAILYDSCTLSGDSFEMFYRPFLNHWITSENSWCWNTEVKKLESSGKMAFNVGFPFSGGVIGTKGKKHFIRGRKPSTQHIEFVGSGELLEPQSLYLEQLARRLST